MSTSTTGNIIDDNEFEVYDSNGLDEKNIKSNDLEFVKMNKKIELISNAKKMLASVQPIYGPELIMNELDKLINEQLNYNTEVRIVNDNIYDLTVCLRGFKNSNIIEYLEKLNATMNYDYFEINIKLNKELYPFYPPQILFKRPKINPSIYFKLINLRMVQLKYWNPTRSLSYIINNLRSIIDNNVLINLEFETTKIPLNIEAEFFNLEFGLNDIDDIDPNKYIITKVSDKETPIVTSNTQKTNNFVSGTGYSNGKSVVWNINNYFKAQAEKDREVINKISNMNKLLCEDIKNGNNAECYQVLKVSPFIFFINNFLNGTTLLEMGKKQDLYKNIYDLLLVLASYKSLIPIFFEIYKQSEDSVHLNVDSVHLNVDLAHLNEESKQTLYSSLLKIQSEYSIIDFSSCKNMFVDAINKILKRCEKFKPVNLHIKEKVVIDEKDMDVYKLYYERMKEYSIGEFDSSGAYNNSGKLSNKSIQHIMEEITSIAKSVPIAYDSSIFTKFNPSNVLAFTALITGPKDTPYSNGCFIFKIELPVSYPATSPKVLSLTTGGGVARFNPNLYECGKVCLSLLGTWAGHASEKWNPLISTIQQVLISIQSLILVDEPYFNEPGYQNSIGTAQGKSASSNYNNTIRLYTMKYAILEYLNNAPNNWKQVINNHFYYKKAEIISVCQKWTDEAILGKKDYELVFNKIKTHLENLKLINDNSDNKEISI
jgi:baculoviral IAP repeat-containing protein 6